MGLKHNIISEFVVHWLISSQQTLMGHNEDNATLFEGLGYILQASYTDSGSICEEITFYCYPGMLCGNAFGFNDKGIVMTQDALSPSNVNTSEEAIGK